MNKRECLKKEEADKIIKTLEPLFSDIKFKFSGGKHIDFWYAKDFWPECKKATTTGNSNKYDYTVACNLQKQKESEYKRNLKEQFQKTIASLGINCGFRSHNKLHHDKLSYDGQSGIVTLNN